VHHSCVAYRAGGGWFRAIFLCRFHIISLGLFVTASRALNLFINPELSIHSKHLPLSFNLRETDLIEDFGLLTHNGDVSNAILFKQEVELPPEGPVHLMPDFPIIG
jgi:hypothetical protein